MSAGRRKERMFSICRNSQHDLYVCLPSKLSCSLLRTYRESYLIILAPLENRVSRCEVMLWVDLAEVLFHNLLHKEILVVSIRISPVTLSSKQGSSYLMETTGISGQADCYDRLRELAQLRRFQECKCGQQEVKFKEKQLE